MPEEAIIIRLSDSALDELARCTSREERGRKLLEFIEPKILKIEEWIAGRYGESLVKFEKAAIRTFLYREITGELDGEGDILHLPQVQQPQANAS